MAPPSAGAGGAAPGGITAFLPFILIIVIFYFLVFRPQQKKAKEHRDMVSNLKKGDRIITSGGIHGTIASIDDTTISLEVSDGIKIKVNRGNVAGLLTGGAAPQKNKKDDTDKKDKKDK